MPRKPGFAYDIRQPVAQANDIRRVRDQHQVVMNYNTGFMGLESIDGQAYPTINQKGLKDVFASCFVPLDDGNKVLIEPDKKTISQRGYGNVVKRKPVGVPKGNRPGITNQDVDVIKHKNNAVYTDFPKGAGRTDTTIIWRDGTYDEAVLSATRQPRGIVPDQTFADILATNPRMREVALASQVGAVAYGDALARAEMEKYFNMEKKEYDKTLLRNLGFTDAEAEARLTTLARERLVNDIAKRFGFSEKQSRNVLDLVVPGDYRTNADVLSAYHQARAERGLPPEDGASNADVLGAFERERAGRQAEARQIASNVAGLGGGRMTPERRREILNMIRNKYVEVRPLSEGVELLTQEQLSSRPATGKRIIRRATGEQASRMVRETRDTAPGVLERARGLARRYVGGIGQQVRQEQRQINLDASNRANVLAGSREDEERAFRLFASRRGKV